MGGAGDIDPGGARILTPTDRAAVIPGATVGDDGIELLALRDATVPDATVPEPIPGEPFAVSLAAVLDRPGVPARVIAGVVTTGLAGLAGSARSVPAVLVVLVPEPTASSGTEPLHALRDRCAELSAAGVPADRLVAEVRLAPGVVGRMTTLRSDGLLVGIVVPHALLSAPGDPAERGAAIALMASAVIEGVASVRTADEATVATVRRVRSVVARLTGSSWVDARMGR